MLQQSTTKKGNRALNFNRYA